MSSIISDPLAHAKGVLALPGQHTEEEIREACNYLAENSDEAADRNFAREFALLHDR
ncbi:hypothetical protein [Salipiger sp.]|uniref:hypothetical protein n=1 Tax=Salipiger sp. TaxID=2078585 RepID=UPI003A9862C0